MIDIVNRLRDRAYCGKAPDTLCEEAANEIERLRKGAVEGRETVQQDRDWHGELLYRLTQAVLSGRFLNKGYRAKLTEAYEGYQQAIGTAPELQPSITEAERQALVWAVREACATEDSDKACRYAGIIGRLLRRMP